MVFEGCSKPVSQMMIDIKLEAFRWAQVENLVSHENSKLWFISPLDAISRHLEN